MAGVDRIGTGKVPTGPLGPGNGVAPSGAGPAGAEEPKADPITDSVAPAVKGKKSRIRASEEIPQAADSGDLPEAVAARAGAPEAFGTLLESGLAVKGLQGLKRAAERLLAAGVPGVVVNGDSSRGGPVALSGEALARLRVKVQAGAGASVVKPSDLGLVEIRFGT